MKPAPPAEIACLRCPRRVREDDHGEFIKWLPMLDEAGEPRGYLCPDCATTDDRRESNLRFPQGGDR